MQKGKQKISPIKQRILQFADSLGVSKREFYGLIDVSRGTLESKTGITEYVVAKFIAAFPSVNIIWLMTGEGDMVKTKRTSEVEPAEPRHISKSKDTNKMEFPQKEKQKKDAIRLAFSAEKGGTPIPLVTPTAAAGFGNGFPAIEEKDVKEYYVIPKFRHCHVDFMIEVSGMSMYPHFCPGDVIACSVLNDTRFIQWNKCHVIATREQGILVKRLRQGGAEDCLCAVSDNSSYPPFDIPKDEITGLALVVGSVSIE